MTEIIKGAWTLVSGFLGSFISSLPIPGVYNDASNPNSIIGQAAEHGITEQDLRESGYDVGLGGIGLSGAAEAFWHHFQTGSLSGMANAALQISWPIWALKTAAKTLSGLFKTSLPAKERKVVKHIQSQLRRGKWPSEFNWHPDLHLYAGGGSSSSNMSSETKVQPPAVADTSSSAPSTTGYSSRGSNYAGRGAKKRPAETAGDALCRQIAECYEASKPTKWLYSFTGANDRLIYTLGKDNGSGAATWCSGTTSGATATTRNINQIALLNGVDSGDDYFNRDGRSINMKRLEIRGFIRPTYTWADTADASNPGGGGIVNKKIEPTNCRTIVLIDKSANDIQPLMKDIFADALNYMDSPLDPTNEQRFIVLADQTTCIKGFSFRKDSTVSPSGDQLDMECIPIHIDVNLDSFTTFWSRQTTQGGSPASTTATPYITSGSLWIITVGTNACDGSAAQMAATYSLQFSSVLYFTSNK